MDNPTIVNDRIGTRIFQTHKLGRPLERFQANFGLGITHAARNQRGGALILDGGTKRKFEFYCISHLIEGKGMLWSECDNSIRRYKAGHAVIITPGYVHVYGGDHDIYVEDTVCFAGRVADTLAEQGLLSSGVFDLGPARRVAPIIAHVMNPTVEEQLRAAVMLEKLLLDIYHENRESSARPDRIGLLLSEIQRQPEIWWTVADMAEYCQMSESHFRRQFQAKTGVAPKHYIEQRKIRLSCELLLQCDLPLAQVARRFGYLDVFHFSRRFKNIVGISPSRYRENYVGKTKS